MEQAQFAASPPTGRVIQILQLLANSPLEPFSLSDLIRELSLSKATSHAVVSTLCECGFLLRHPISKTFTLGPALVSIGQAAAQAQPDLAYATQELESLTRAIGIPGSISALINGDIIALASTGSLHSKATPPPVGYRVPFIPPFGSSFIASAENPDAMLEQWFNGGFQYSNDDRSVYLERVKNVKAHGFGIDCLTETEVKLRQILVEMSSQQTSPEIAELTGPIFERLRHRDTSYERMNRTDAIEVSEIFAPAYGTGFAISLHLHQGRLTAKEIESLGEQLVEACSRITTAAAKEGQ